MRIWCVWMVILPCCIAAWGCAQIPGLSRSGALRSGESATAVTSSKTKAGANLAAKVDRASRKELEGRGEKVDSRLVRNRYGAVASDGVFELATRLKPAFARDIEGKPELAESPSPSSLLTPNTESPSDVVVAQESEAEVRKDEEIVESAGLPSVEATESSPESSVVDADTADVASASDGLVPPPPVEVASAEDAGLPDLHVESKESPSGATEDEAVASAVAGGGLPAVAVETSSTSEADGVANGMEIRVTSIPRAERNPSGVGEPPMIADGVSLTGSAEEDAATVAVASEDAPPKAVSEGTIGSVRAAAGSEKAVEDLIVQASQTEFESIPAEVVAANALDAVPVPPVFQAVDAASEAMDKDGVSRAFQLSRLQLCSEILGFGSTVPLASPTLVQGRQSLAYVEVQGYSSLLEDGEYVTRLVSQVVLEDENGSVLWQEDFEEIVDRCATRRRDFFCHFVFTVPDDVPVGHCRLRLRVMDTQGPAAHESSLPVDVVPAGAVHN